MDTPGRSETWTAYACVATVALLVYALGAVTPLLRDELGLTQSVAALHATTLAVGIIGAGLVADRIPPLVGPARATELAMACLATSAVLLVLAGHVLGSLAAAVLIGFGGGMLLAYVTPGLTGDGDAAGRTRMTRANTAAIAVALGAPLAVGWAVALGLGWRGLFLVPLAVVAMLSVAAGRRDVVPPPVDDSPGHGERAIPRRYWFAWAFVVLGVAIEFSFVFWASTLVAQQTGVALPDAVVLAGLFLAGMLAGRFVLGLGVGARVSSRRLLTSGLVVLTAGAVVVWLATDPLPAAVGLAIAGIGTAPFYPVGITVAMAQAPGAAVVASTRLALASGTAVLTAPLVLGLVADAVGVSTGWIVVPLLAAAALLVLAAIPARS